MVTTISSTELKNKVSEVINDVAFKGNVTVVERHGKALVKIVPIEEKPKEDIKEALDRLFGSMPDFPDVTRDRKFTKRKISLE